MPATNGSPRRCSELQQYEVRVQGHLDSRWADRLDGLTLTRERDGTTTLRGPPVDQTAPQRHASASIPGHGLMETSRMVWSA